MNTKPILLTAALFLIPAALGAGLITETYSFTPAQIIPGDGGAPHIISLDLSGLSGSHIVNLTEVQVGLHLTGNAPVAPGWAGDMIVLLNRNGGDQTASLLNQVGVSSANSAGFSFDGWNVTLQDSALANGDIHLGQPTGTILTGMWQPDGRSGDAFGDPLRTQMLAVFNGMSANTVWDLYLYNLGAEGDGTDMTLNSWSLNLTGDNGIAAVPEPKSWALMGAGLLALVAGRRWRR